MRTTLNIDDELLRQLKHEAGKSRVPLRRLVNIALRRGLAALSPARTRRAYKCPSFNLGKPTVNLEKTLALAARLEDTEALRD